MKTQSKRAKEVFNRVYNEDCIAGMKRLPAACVDLAFADPPFNIGYEYDAYHDKLPREEYLDWCRRWIGEVTRVLKPEGAFWLAIGDEWAAELKLLMQDVHGLSCRSWVIWYYTFGVHCTNKFARSHAHLFFMVKDPERFTFNGDAIRVPSARQLVYGDRRSNPKGRLPDDTWMLHRPAPQEEARAARSANGNAAAGSNGHDEQHTWVLRPQDIPASFQPEEDTWFFSRVCGTFKERAGWHGCQMPEQLLGRIIRVSSNPGDLVLDPFAGSGTTLAVAKKLDRRWIGYELSKEYAARIKSRLASISPGDALDGAPDPTLSAPSTANGVRWENGKRVSSRKKAKR